MLVVRIRRFALALHILCVSFATATAAHAAPSPLLAIDPSLERYTLPNGMRVWVRYNDNPKGQVDLRLRIGVGSRAEPTRLNGLAHFAEHMAFNGSTHFAVGELTSRFESLGVAFATHQNGYTGYSETVYNIAMPTNAVAPVELAVVALADFGFGSLDAVEEVEKERGVLLSELRNREGDYLRILRQRLPLLFPGAALESHFGIGSSDDIEAVRRSDLQRFRKRWYRPDNADLVVVGDIHLAQLRAALDKYFGAWPVDRRAKPAVPPVPASGPLQAATFTGPEVTWSILSWDVVDALTALRDEAAFRDELVDAVTEMAFAVRLDQLRRSGRLRVQAVNVRLGHDPAPARLSSVSITMDPKVWRSAASTLLTEWWRASKHGFDDVELAGAKRAVLANLNRARRENRTAELADGMVFDIGYGRTLTSREEKYRLASLLAPQISAQDVKQRFIKRFSRRGLLSLTQPQGEAPVERDELMNLWRAPQRRPIEAPPASAPLDAVDGWLREGSAQAAATEKTYHAATRVVSVWLDNGVRLHARSMPNEPGRVRVAALFAGAQLLERDGSRGVSDIAAEVLSAISTRTVTSAQFRQYLLGRMFSIGGGNWGDGLGISIGADKDELRRSLQVATKLVLEGSLSASDFEVARMSLAKARLWENTQPKSVAAIAMEALISCADPRVRPPNEQELQRATQTSSQEWFNLHMKEAPIEVALVGDATESELLAAGTETFGQLPRRPRIGPQLDKLRQPQCASLSPGPHAMRIPVNTAEKRTAIEISWQGPAYNDLTARAALDFAATILRTRLRESLREDNSLTYHVNCHHTAVFPLMSQRRLAVATQVAPPQEAAALTVLNAAFDRFVSTGPSAAEMDAARTQLLRQLDEQQQSAAHWTSTLGSLDFRGRSLDDVADESQRLKQVTKEALMAVVKRYLTAANRYEVVAFPAPAAAK